MSPIAKSKNNPTLKKIEIKQTKTHTKTEYNSAKHPIKSVKNDGSVKIHKLFIHLTRENPNGVKILSP